MEPGEAEMHRRKPTLEDYRDSAITFVFGGMLVFAVVVGLISSVGHQIADPSTVKYSEGFTGVKKFSGLICLLTIDFSASRQLLTQSRRRALPAGKSERRRLPGSQRLSRRSR